MSFLKFEGVRQLQILGFLLCERLKCVLIHEGNISGDHIRQILDRNNFPDSGLQFEQNRMNNGVPLLKT